MTRNEMIDILIEDRLWEWVYSQCYESLEDVLYFGFEGFNKYTNQELKEAVKHLDKEDLTKIKVMLKEKTQKKFK